MNVWHIGVGGRFPLWFTRTIIGCLVSCLSYVVWQDVYSRLRAILLLKLWMTVRVAFLSCTFLPAMHLGLSCHFLWKYGHENRLWLPFLFRFPFSRLWKPLILKEFTSCKRFIADFIAPELLLPSCHSLWNLETENEAQKKTRKWESSCQSIDYSLAISERLGNIWNGALWPVTID